VSVWKTGRPRNRRLLGALVMAGLVLAGSVVFVLLDAKPAEAFCPSPPPPGCGGTPPEPPATPWPWPLPTTPAPWTPPIAPGGGGGGQGAGNTQPVKDVSDRVKRALADDTCNSFVSGNQPAGNDARSRLPRVTLVERPTETYGPKPAAAATANGMDAGTGGGTITLWRPYFDDARVSAGLIGEAKRESPALYDTMMSWADSGGRTNVRMFRVLVVLHEMAHLTGKLPGDTHQGDWEPNNQAGFHLKLVNACPIPRD
jgi:hypothetical protein